MRGASQAVWPHLSVPLRLLLFSQLGFNIGFYLVVPFLAAHLTENLHLAGWVVGAVLGLRTFSQQGLFVLGGALADRIGVKTSVVTGCAVRIAGFLVLAVAQSLPAVVVGVVLVGVAAALFSPATESAIAAWGGELERAGGPTRTQVLALESVYSKVGSILGPLVGGVLLVVPFATTCLAAAAVFGVILVAQVLLLPGDARAGEATPLGESLRAVATDRDFLLFGLLHSSYFLAFAMLYLALPVELRRVGAPSAAVTWFFALAAVVVIALQLPVTRATSDWSAARRLAVGYALLASCFVPVALVATQRPAPGAWVYVAPAVLVTVLHLGQILVLPTGRDVVARIARERRLGTYLGALASLGGLVVLLGGTVFGRLLDLAEAPGAQAAVPWFVMALPPLVSAIAVGPFLRARCG